jgi:hypothetical protein
MCICAKANNVFIRSVLVPVGERSPEKEVLRAPAKKNSKIVTSQGRTKNL